MPSPKSILILAWALATLPLSAADGAETRLLFTGDVLLSRQVRREIEQTKQSPWADLTSTFQRADWVLGNLEGAVGPPDGCQPRDSASPCFDISPDLIPLLARAGFRAMSIANNHSRDLGEAGLASTRESLKAAELTPISFEESPVFFSVGGHTIAVIAISTVPARDGSRDAIPSTELRQKLRLARNLAELVIVSIHWGSELLDWPETRQREMAAWLVRNGAGLIIGHHPHVVQAPECVAGRPVFYSLGNHLFDQKYPATKTGMIADCRIRGSVLTCSGIPTKTPEGSAFPGIALESPDLPALKACPVPLNTRSEIGGVSLRAQMLETADTPARYVIEGWHAESRVWRSAPLPLVSIQPGIVAAPRNAPYAITLERHHSPIDQEEGLRPYVYEVGPRGLIARWRGSALAWPLLDAELLPGGRGLLCALHRSDSFVILRPDSHGVRTTVYRWNGFGFSGVSDPAAIRKCRALFHTDQ